MSKNYKLAIDPFSRGALAARFLEALLSVPKERWQDMIMFAKFAARPRELTNSEAVAAAAVSYADSLIAELNRE